jgi:hypothetical protein
MALLNYTTQVEAIKTAGEITAILVDHGAQAIFTEYGANKEVAALSFEVLTPHGAITIRLPVDAKQWQRGKIPRRYVNREQANRIAWRIVKDWVSAQMAILETEMVRMEQIFLPYAITRDGKTFYESLVGTGFKQLQEG